MRLALYAPILPVLLAGSALVAPGLRAQDSVPAALRSPRFVPNYGQWDEAVEFGVLGWGGDAWLLRDGFVFRLQRTASPGSGGTDGRGPTPVVGAVLRFSFEGARPARLEGEDLLPGRHHFLRGADAGWVRDVPAFRAVRYRGIHPGIDLRVRPLPGGGRDAIFEYDLLLAPGADLAGVAVHCEGAEHLELEPDGGLAVHVKDGDGRGFTLRQMPPVSFQVREGGDQVAVPCRIRLLGERRFAFEVEGRDPGLDLLVDPGIVWSTYVGGGSSDAANAMRHLSGSGVFLGGFTGSSDFPTTPGAFRTTGQRDAFVAKLSEDGSQLLWSTYLGGSDGEEVRGLDVDAAGNVTVVGWAVSGDFPVTAGALQSVNRGGSVILDTGDVFVTRLRADGAQLLGSTFLGGTLDEVAEDVVVDAAGNATVVGWTASLDFPTTPGALQGAIGSPLQLRPDGFVARVSGDGRTAAFVTYLGGFLRDELHAVHVDGNGVTTVAGFSESADYPTSISALRTTLAGVHDAVVTRLDAQGSAIVWSTYLGGAEHDRALALDVLQDGSVLLGGATASPNFPASSGALQTALQGATDGFVARISGNGMTLPWATYLGGSGEDVVRALDPDGNDVVVVGETQGGFPTTAMAPQPAFGGGVLDGFLARIDQGGTVLGFSTYLGGSADDVLAGVDETAGLATVAGWTWSPDWPSTPGSVQPAPRGSIEVCVAQIDMLMRLAGTFVIRDGELAEDEFVPGTSFPALAIELDNGTPRPVEVTALRCFLGGTGDNTRDLSAVSLWWDRDGDRVVGTGDVMVAGPQAPPADNREFDLTPLGMTVGAGAVEHLLVELTATPQCPSGAEFACAVTERGAWGIRASGAGTGPTVLLGGEEFVQGPAMACDRREEFSGDANGDGVLDVRDLRGLARRLGEAAAGVDPDGDGMVTVSDLILLQERVLDRPIALSIPTAIQPGVPLVIGGWGLHGSVVATLGGRVLPRLCVTDRELSFAVDPSLPPGQRTLILDLGGTIIIQTPIQVR